MEIILCIVWGFCDSIKDTVEHHPNNRLSNLPGWWGKWFKSDYREWPLFLGFIRWDAKHIFKWLAYVSAIGFGYTVYDLARGIAGILLAILTFLLFYKHIWVKKETKDEEIINSCGVVYNTEYVKGTDNAGTYPGFDPAGYDVSGVGSSGGPGPVDVSSSYSAEVIGRVMGYNTGSSR